MATRTSSRADLSDREKALLDRYTSLLGPDPGPISVWAWTEDGLLHVYTLIPEGRDNLKAVISAERALLRTFDPLEVDFDVYEDAEVAREVFSGQEPAFSRADARIVRSPPRGSD